MAGEVSVSMSVLRGASVVFALALARQTRSSGREAECRWQPAWLGVGWGVLPHWTHSMRAETEGKVLLGQLQLTLPGRGLGKSQQQKFPGRLRRKLCKLKSKTQVVTAREPTVGNVPGYRVGAGLMKFSQNSMKEDAPLIPTKPGISQIFVLRKEHMGSVRLLSLFPCSPFCSRIWT